LIGVPKGEPMPQTIEAYKLLAQRDLELIEDQKVVITAMALRLHKLEQRMKRAKERK
jgi:hypothetical protein